MADESSQNNSSPQPQPNNQKNLGSFVEKFRGYESDMARLKGVPLEPVVPDKPLVSQPKPAPVNPLDIAGKPEPYIEAQGNTSQTLDATNTFISDVVPEDPKKAVDALHKETPLQQFRTIQSDLASASQQKKASPTNTVEDIISAQLKNTKHPIIVEDPKRSYFALMLSSILILAGLIALGGWYLIKTRPQPTAPVVVDTKNIISTDKSEDLIIDQNTSITDSIVALQKQPAGTHNELIKLVAKAGTSTEPIPGSDFATLFSPTIPSWLARSFSNVYLVGLYNSVNAGWQPIMVFKVDSYENAYSGMLKWEETMPQEFAPFTANIKKIASTATSTSTATGTDPLPQNQIVTTGFKDAVIKNKDARVLEDAFGRRILMYSFADQNTLVITTDQSALEEAFARLATSQFVR